jgi:crossover junction endodeoxyribonuclease RusA
MDIDRRKSIYCKLPFPPSANVYWRTFRGMTVVSKEARQYKEFVAALLHNVLPLAGALSLVIEYHFPTEAGDLSNRIKVLEDALNGIAYEDDKQVIGLTASKHVIPPIKKRKGVTSTKREGYVLIGIVPVEAPPILFGHSERHQESPFGVMTF